MKTNNETEAKRYDVVIYKIETMKVESVIGTNMESVNTREMGRDGHNTAELRRQTGQERVNEYYDVAIVDAGKFQKGSTISKSDIRLNY